MAKKKILKTAIPMLMNFSNSFIPRRGLPQVQKNRFHQWCMCVGPIIRGPQ